MKKSLLSIAVSLMFLFAGTGIGLAGPGDGSRMGGGGGNGGGGGYGGGNYGTYGGGYCGGTGIPYICEGDSKEYIDYFVRSINIYGAGLGASMTINESAVENGIESIAIFGLGPWWFWNDNTVNLPAAGDKVTVVAKEIDLSGAKRIVAMSVTVYDTNGVGATLQLRDPETCYPNWAGGWSR